MSDNLIEENIDGICAFTGHRDMEDIPDERELESLLNKIIEEGTDTFLCGMARGFDLFAAQAVLKIKDGGKNVKLIACVPCPGQERFFNSGDKEQYDYVMSRCDRVIILSGNYFKGCMQMRDRYMVDNSARLIAYCRKEKGGTAYTLKYAEKKGKIIYKI